MRPAKSQKPRRVDEPAVVEAMKDYNAARTAGKVPSRAKLLARFPEIAVQLSACLDALDFLQQAASQM